MVTRLEDGPAPGGALMTRFWANSMVTAERPAQAAPVTTAVTESMVTAGKPAETAPVTTAVTETLSEIATAVMEAENRLAKIEQTISAIEDRPRCNGSEYWRELKTGRALYANHGPDECPLHGQHPEGKRHRVYIGMDGLACQQALAAMSNYDKWLRLEDKRRHMKHWLMQVDQKVNQLRFFTTRGW